MAQEIQSAAVKFPERTLRIISGPTVVDSSRDQARFVVSYEAAFAFNNGQKRLKGKVNVELTI